MPEINESSTITINLKLFWSLIVALAISISSVIGVYYELDKRISAAKELPKPGTGFYIVDRSDPNAVDSWPVSKIEFTIKGDQIARDEIKRIKKALKDNGIEVEEPE
ncbi:MAG: hypothetical protein H8E14_10260 [Candidatus Marinimicrobia bacterium]|nr:hypothetical protein [Candidatus Neomarinimicrobiota bacterium]